MKTYLFFLELGPPEIRVGNLSNLEVAFYSRLNPGRVRNQRVVGHCKKKGAFLTARGTVEVG